MAFTLLGHAKKEMEREREKERESERGKGERERGSYMLTWNPNLV